MIATAAAVDETLHPLILARMEADDGQHPAVLEQRLGSGEAAVQLAQLVIDPHAERLERAGRRIARAAPSALGGTDGRCQLLGARDRSRVAPSDNGAGDTTGVGLAAELPQHARQLGIADGPQRSAAVGPWWLIRMSSEPERWNEKPRAASSSWNDETPGRGLCLGPAEPASASSSAIAPNLPSIMVNRGSAAASSRPRSTACGSRSIPTTRHGAAASKARL